MNVSLKFTIAYPTGNTYVAKKQITCWIHIIVSCQAGTNKKFVPINKSFIETNESSVAPSDSSVATKVLPVGYI